MLMENEKFGGREKVNGNQKIVLVCMVTRV